MNGEMATAGLSRSSRGDAAPPPWGPPPGRGGGIGTAPIRPAPRLWVPFLPGLMSAPQSEDGPYFGSAVRLVHGVLPYRDYAFVQPPGITELMSPAALDSYLSSTASALVIGRFLTVFAGAAALVLAGFLVRHRG